MKASNFLAISLLLLVLASPVFANQDIITPPRPFSPICPECGILNIQDARYCASCGSHLQRMQTMTKLDSLILEDILFSFEDPIVRYREGRARMARITQHFRREISNDSTWSRMITRSSHPFATPIDSIRTASTTTRKAPPGSTPQDKVISGIVVILLLLTIIMLNAA